MASYFIRNSTRANKTVEGASERAAVANGATPRRFFTQQTMSLGESFDHHPEGSTQQLMAYYTMPETDPRHAKFHEHRLQVQLQNAIDAERRVKAEVAQQRRLSLGNYSRRSSVAVAKLDDVPQEAEPTVNTYVSVRFPQLAPALTHRTEQQSISTPRRDEDSAQNSSPVARHEFTTKLPALSAHRRGGGGGAAASARQLRSSAKRTKGDTSSQGALTGRSTDDDRAAIKLLEAYAVAPREGLATSTATSISARLTTSMSTHVLAPPKIPDDAKTLLDAALTRHAGEGESYITPANANYSWEQGLRQPLHAAPQSQPMDEDPSKDVDAALLPAPPVDSLSPKQRELLSETVRQAMLFHTATTQAGAALWGHDNTTTVSHDEVGLSKSVKFDQAFDTSCWSPRVPGVNGGTSTSDEEWMKRLASAVSTFQHKLRQQHDYFVALIHDRAALPGAEARLVQISALSKTVDRLEAENDDLTSQFLNLTAAMKSESTRADHLSRQLHETRYQLEDALHRLEDAARRKRECVDAINQTSLTVEGVGKLEDASSVLRSATSLGGFGSMRLPLPSPRKPVSDNDFQPETSMGAAPSAAVASVAHESGQLRAASAQSNRAAVLHHSTDAHVGTDTADLMDTAAQTDISMRDFDSEPDSPTSSPRMHDMSGFSPQSVMLGDAPPLANSPGSAPSPGDANTPHAPGERKMTFAPRDVLTLRPPPIIEVAPAVPEQGALHGDPYASDGVISVEVEAEHDLSDTSSTKSGSFSDSPSHTAQQRKSSHATSTSTVEADATPSAAGGTSLSMALSMSSKDGAQIKSPLVTPTAPRNNKPVPPPKAAHKSVGLLGADVSPRNRSGSIMSSKPHEGRRLSTMSTAPLQRAPSSLTQTTAAASNRETAIKIDETLSRLKRKNQAAVRTAVTRTIQGTALGPVAPPIGTIGFVAIAAFPEDTKTLTLLSSWMTDEVINGGAAWPVFFDATTCIIAFANPAKALEFALDQLILSRFAFAVDVLSIDTSHVVGPFACYESTLTRGMQNLVSFSAKGEVVVPAPVYKTYVSPLREVLVVMKVEATFHCTLDEVDLFSLHKEGIVIPPRSVAGYDPLLPLGGLAASSASAESPSPSYLHPTASLARAVRKRPPLSVRCVAPTFALPHGSVAAGNRGTSSLQLNVERLPMLIVYSNEKHPSVEDTKQVFSVGLNATVKTFDVESGPDEQSLITHSTQTVAPKKRNVACGFGEIELALAPLASSTPPNSTSPRHEVEIDHGSDGESDNDVPSSERGPTPAIPFVLKKRQVLTEMFSCPCCATLFNNARVFIPCGHVYCNSCIMERMRFLPKDDYDVAEYRCKICLQVSFDAPVPCVPIDIAVRELVLRGAVGEA